MSRSDVESTDPTVAAGRPDASVGSGPEPTAGEGADLPSDHPATVQDDTAGGAPDTEGRTPAQKRADRARHRASAAQAKADRSAARAQERAAAAEQTDGTALGPRPVRWISRSLPARHGLRLAVLALLVVFVVGSGVALGVSAHRWWTQRSTDDVAAQAQGAASSLVPRLLNYNFRTIDADTHRIDDAAVGPLADQNRAVTDGMLKPAVSDGQAVSTSTVTTTGLVSAAPNQAVVVVFFVQNTTSTQLPGPRVDNRAARLTIVQGGDGIWRASAFDPL